MVLDLLDQMHKSGRITHDEWMETQSPPVVQVIEADEECYVEPVDITVCTLRWRADCNWGAGEKEEDLEIYPPRTQEFLEIAGITLYELRELPALVCYTDAYLGDEQILVKGVTEADDISGIKLVKLPRRLLAFIKSSNHLHSYFEPAEKITGREEQLEAEDVEI